MREILIHLPQDKRPKYLKIASSLRQLIQKGILKPNEKLPSIRTLSNLLNTHRLTILTALRELISEGWVVSSQRRFYKVNQELPSDYTQTTVTTKTVHHNTIPFKINNPVKIKSNAIKASTQPLYSFTAEPDLRLFPLKEFRSYVLDSLKKNPKNILGYSKIAGYPTFVEQLKVYLRRMRGLSHRKILVTYSSQESIYLISRLLLKKGDTVAVENLCYPRAQQTFKTCGAKTLAIKLDHQGIIPEDLEKKLKKTKIKLIYLTSLHQFPTTVTLPIARRLSIYQLAKKYNVPILEDDYNHEYHYDSQPPPPLASEDPQNLILYTATFSHLLFPSVRVAFIAIPNQLYEALKTYKSLVSTQHINFHLHAIAGWMRDGGLERHLRRTRRIYKDRRNTLISCIEQAQKKGLNVSFKKPEGGMSIWLNLHQDSLKVAQKAATRGISITPESYYSCQASHKIGTHLRMGFTAMDTHEIKKGFSELIKTIS